MLILPELLENREPKKLHLNWRAVSIYYIVLALVHAKKMITNTFALTSLRNTGCIADAAPNIFNQARKRERETENRLFEITYFILTLKKWRQTEC